MPLNVSLSFPGSPAASAVVAAGLKVQRYELAEALSALFELTLEVLSPDPAIDMAAVVGQAVVVDFGDEPFLKQLRGLVRRAVQHTAVPTGDSRYEWIVVPPLWLTTQRSDHRIFQERTIPEIVALVIAGPEYKGRIPPVFGKTATPPPRREYCVQYGETDHDFLFRILAEEGLVTYFDHANESAWTLTVDPTDADDLLGKSVPFSDPANLNPLVLADPAAPHVSAVTFAAGVATSAATIRSWDFERPALKLEEKSALPASRALPNEADLEAYVFEIGTLDREPEPNLRVDERLQNLRAFSRTLVCEASFALPPGFQMTLADHPRSDLNEALLVVEARTVAVFGAVARRVLTCIALEKVWMPARRPKPRIHGTQTAIVVGAEGQEIDVDAFGRVEVEFHWDRRDRHAGGTSRRVRVAQGWAGAGFGFVMLPRVNEEVIVAYLDGDPDQPIIVGRVHNAMVTSPLNLPAQKTVSVWRSRTSPGGDGFNQILMDDLAGAERLELHAQRDFTHEVGRNAITVVRVDQTMKVAGNQTASVKGDQTTDVEGMIATTATAGIAEATSGNFSLSAHGDVTIVAAGDRSDVTVGDEHHKAHAIELKAEDVVAVHAPAFTVDASAMIALRCGGSSIEIYPDTIRIKSGGPVEVNGAVVKLNC